jgi:hypothetical protein
MRRTRLLLAAILCLLFLGPVQALAEEKGIIRGQVVNGTVGGGSTGGLEVALRVFQETREQDALTTTTDSQGSFRFEGLEAGGHWAYLIRISYRDVVYSKGPLSFEPGQSELATEVWIHETTTSDEGIVVEMAHLFIEVSDASLSVTEVHFLSNPGDRTYIGKEEVQGRRTTSRFLLPQGSYDLSFDDGWLGGRFLATKGGFADTEPLWPGRTTVMFHYALDCKGSDCSLVKDVTLATTSLNVFVPDTGLHLESERLTLQGKVGGEKQTFLSYVGHNLAPGERLVLRFVGLAPGAREPAISTPTASAKRNLPVVPLIAVGVAMAALILGYPLWRQRFRASNPERDPE